MVEQSKNREEENYCKKYAKYVHIGEKRALYEFPTIRTFLLKPEVQEELNLTTEEIEYLNKEN